MTEIAPHPHLETGVQLLLDLQDAGAVTPVSLDLDDPELPFERYEALGGFLGRISRSSRWWLGDWLIFGEGAYGERVYQAAAATGLNEETLQHYRRVCESVPKSRRFESLSFGCHALVAGLPPAAQKRWLKKAEAEGWGTRELALALREAEHEAGGQQGSFDGTEPGETDHGMLEEVARAILRDARELDDGDYAVPREDIERLKAAVGE